MVFSIDVGREQLHPSLRGHSGSFPWKDRHPRFRGQALSRAAGHRRHRRQLHLAESRAAVALSLAAAQCICWR